MSITILGIITFLLGTTLNRLGVPVAEAELTPVVTNIFSVVSLLMQIGGAGWAWYGRYRKGDISVAGLKQ